jgi:hypothetical protein
VHSCVTREPNNLNPLQPTLHTLCCQPVNLQGSCFCEPEKHHSSNSCRLVDSGLAAYMRGPSEGPTMSQSCITCCVTRPAGWPL